MSLVTDKALVVGLITDSVCEPELMVLREMKRLGARTLAIMESAKGIDLTGIDEVIELNSGINETDRTTLYLPLMRWLAFLSFVRKGAGSG